MENSSTEAEAFIEIPRGSRPSLAVASKQESSVSCT